MIYRFDNCELDTGRILLRRDDTVVPIEPQVFDLLLFLLEHRGQMVTKEALFDSVWGSRFVSESALTSRIKSARQAIGDDGARQTSIRTVRGKGYEFVADVTTSDPEVDRDPAVPIPPTGIPMPPRRGDADLPLAVHSLIGRDELLAQLLDDLDHGRAVTVVGPAGVGKTSIGVELARRSIDRHSDGVVLVELVEARSRNEALAAMATRLDVNVRQHVSLDTAIIDLLRPRDILLVLDNCEHLIEPVAQLCDQIMRSAPGVTILATSREPLAIPGERVHVIDPLDVNGLDTMELDELAAAPAVALFVERAQAADSRFELTAATAPAVAEICQRLDGIPLALELAASRTHAIDVDEIARRLDERLRLLRAVRRGADPRHSTLLDAVSWSYDLLDADEQRLFAELAVFAGAFELEDAEAICHEADIIDLLTRLSQRSMVAVRRPATGGTRYEMLETLREFGRSRLEDLESVVLFRTHARHFADLARSVEATLRSPDERSGLATATRAFADLRAAQRFAVESGDVDIALELITSIREYGMRSLRYEVFTWAEEAAAIATEPHPLRPTLTALRAYGSFVRGEIARALALADEADADRADQGLDPVGLTARVRGNALFLQGDTAAAGTACSTMIAIAEATGLPSDRAHAYYMSSVGASSTGDYDLAGEYFRAAFDAAHRTGCPTDLAGAWSAKGFGTRDDDAAALDAFSSADRIARAAGNRWMSAFASTEASILRLNMGSVDAGCRGLAETVDIWYRAGEWAQQWLTLSRCVIALDQIGQHEFAAEVLGAIERHAELDAPPSLLSTRSRVVEVRDSLVERLGDERAAELRSGGALLPLPTLVHRVRTALIG